MRRAIRDKANLAQSSDRVVRPLIFTLVSLGIFFALSLLASAGASAAVHGPYTLLGDECASCHRTHTAQNKSILKSTAPQSTLCFTCHDGTGSSLNVLAQYSANPTLVNVAGTRDYYSHAATITSVHTRSDFNEFGGVSNRHSECGDCHNSHNARSIASSTSTTGWSTSGRMASLSGVSVVNGAAGTVPTYTFLNGINTGTTKEYQICFKCHSGFTVLPGQLANLPANGSIPVTPQLSRNYLDKGIEFNPANLSMHPIEAAGKNLTAKMAASLSTATNPTTLRLWTFTTASTIRCTQCHSTETAISTTTDLPTHKSTNRGILIRKYVDRDLKLSTAAYAYTDFALCYACHANTAFADTSKAVTATSNFRLHGFHLGNISGMGNAALGTNIDTPGAGQGNAICAECHFRLHSSTYKGGAQTGTDRGLVNFAPNILPSGTTRAWTSTTVGTGSCTLTCHGVDHSGWSY